MTGFAVGFAGSRDNYEVALALAEIGRLDALVTDLYLKSGRLAGALAPWIAGDCPRHHPALPNRRVRTVARAFAAQKLASRRWARTLFGADAQASVAHAFAAHAVRRPVGLFPYAGYGLAAFRAHPDRRRILFQYHPQRAFERAELERHLGPRGAFDPAPFAADPDDAPNIEEIHLADTVVCASSFTRRSVLHVAPGKRVVLAPYGASLAIDEAAALAQKADPSRPTFLFVGSGIPRKGIGLLLDAFAHTAPPGAALRLVVRNADPATARRLAAIDDDRITVRSNLGRADLLAEFRRAHVFVLPAISEGFAHVVPEALASGCHVIASDATCLADLDPPPEAGEVIPAGDAETLAAAIASAAAGVSSGAIDGRAALALARRFSWSRFRRTIQALATEGDAP
ncbi:Glycosyl transferase, group 1 family protein [Stappia sp. 22II-S9-Z10]|nr:Glycosyl transferase, group 1 family protein [Stappia sp. 22II-S9-Z10]